MKRGAGMRSLLKKKKTIYDKLVFRHTPEECKVMQVCVCIDVNVCL